MHKVSSKDRYGRQQKALDKPKITTLPPDKVTPAPDLADVIIDPETNINYKRGRFLGKVNFFEVLNFFQL